MKTAVEASGAEKARQDRASALLDAEKTVLAQFILAPGSATEIIVPLLGDGDAFTGRGHRAIYLAARRLGLACDLPALSHELAGVVEASSLSALLDDPLPHGREVIEHHCRMILAEARRRDLLSAAVELHQRLVAGGDDDEALRQFQQRTATLPGRREALSERVLWGADLESAELETPSPLVGSGLLTRGDYSVLIGPKGMGKTWITIELGGRVAKGEAFFGLATVPCRVLIISLELKSGEVRDRLKALGHYPIPSNLGVLGKEAFALDKARGATLGLPRLADPAHQERIARVVEEAHADLVCIDPIGVTMAKENDELPAVALFFLDLTNRSRCHLWAPHHVRKPDGSHSRLRITDSRGPTQLTDWASCVLTIGKTRGQYLLGHPEENGPRHCAPIDDVWLKRRPDGPFTQTDAPKSQEEDAELKRTLLREELEEKGFVRVAEAASRLKCSEECVRGHLKKIDARQEGHGKASVWVWPAKGSPIAKPSLPNVGESPHQYEEF